MNAVRMCIQYACVVDFYVEYWVVLKMSRMVKMMFVEFSLKKKKNQYERLDLNDISFFTALL